MHADYIYLVDIGKYRVLRDFRNSSCQQMACTLACVVQLVPYSSKDNPIRLVWRNLLPEFCMRQQILLFRKFAN